MKRTVRLLLELLRARVIVTALLLLLTPSATFAQPDGELTFTEQLIYWLSKTDEEDEAERKSFAARAVAGAELEYERVRAAADRCNRDEMELGRMQLAAGLGWLQVFDRNWPDRYITDALPIVAMHAKRASLLELRNCGTSLAGLWRRLEGDQVMTYRLEETGDAIRMFPDWTTPTPENTMRGRRDGDVILLGYPPAGGYECPAGAPARDVVGGSALNISAGGDVLTLRMSTFNVLKDCSILLGEWVDVGRFQRVKAPAGQ